MGGIGRLGMKQQRRSRLSCSFAEEGDREEEMMKKKKNKKEEKEVGVVVKERRRSTTISEATVCMLMDRFAPS